MSKRAGRIRYAPIIHHRGQGGAQSVFLEKPCVRQLPVVDRPLM